MNRGNARSSRVTILAIVMFASIGMYAIKLFSMQILNGDAYRKQSQNISQRVKKIPAQRGEIFDRNGTVPMVLNIDSFAVDITPGEVPKDQYQTVISRLSSILGITVESIEKKIPQANRRSFESVEVRANDPYQTIAAVSRCVVALETNQKLR